MKKLFTLLAILLIPTLVSALPPSPPPPASTLLGTYTVGTLPATPDDGDLAVVTDGDDGADCTVGLGTSLNVCIYDAGGAAWVIAGDGSGSGSAFSTHNAPQGTDPVASGADTLTWLEGEGIDITGDNVADSIEVAAEDASDTNKGVIEIATDAEAVAVTEPDKALVPSNMDDLLAEPPAIGDTTPAAGSFTTLSATGLLTRSGNDPIVRFDDTDNTDWELRVDDAGDSFEIGSSNGGVDDHVELEIDEDGDIHVTGDVYVTGDNIFMGADPADAGTIRLGLGATINFEATTNEANITHVDDTGFTTNQSWSAEHLISTDDADINDSLTVGDLVVDETAGVIDFSGATSATIQTSGDGTDLTIDVNDTAATATLLIDNTGDQGIDVIIGASGGTGSISLYSEGASQTLKFLPSGSMTEDSTYTWPVAKPDSAKFLQSSTGGVLSWAASTGAYINDPGTSIDNEIVRWSGTDGDAVNQTSGITIDDNADMHFGDDDEAAFGASDDGWVRHTSGESALEIGGSVAGVGLIIDMLDAAADSGNTYVEIEGSSPIHTTGTLNDVWLNIDAEIGNASGGTITADLIKIDALTQSSANVTLNAINIGAVTTGAGTETAIKIGSGFDIILDANDADLSEAELEILDGATTTTTQLNYLNAATGTTGTTSTNLVFSTSPTLITPTLGVASATSLETTGDIELGNSSDTTIHRESAGVISVEGAVVSLLGATIGASEVDADVATQAELDTVAALVDTADEIIAIINTSPTSQIAVGAGGTGANLADPNADRLIGWDDTGGTIQYFIIGSGLSYDEGTDTISATGAATAWDDLTAPDNDETLDMTGFWTEWDFGDTDHDMFTFYGTGNFGDYSVVRIEQKTGTPTDGDLLSLVTANAAVDHLVMDFAGTDYVTHKIVDAGTYTIDVTSDGTAAIALADSVTFGSTATFADDQTVRFGSAATDWYVEFDDSVDDQLLWHTTATASVATTDPMFEILADFGTANGTGMTADQQIFGVAKGTQASNVSLFWIDEDGDVYIYGDLTLNGSMSMTEANNPGWYFNSTDVDWWLNVNDSGNSMELRLNSTLNQEVVMEWFETGDITIGRGAADEDIDLTFNGESNDGVITWMEDEAYFSFDSPINGRFRVTDDGTDNNVSKAEMNGLILDQDGDTWVLADIDAADGTGWSVCFYGDSANAITVDPDAEDIIIDTFDDGGAESAGESITSGGSAGDMICLVVVKFSSDIAYWAVTSENGTWTPED